MFRTPIRIAATVVTVAAALSGAAFGASGRASASQAATLDSFGSTTSVARVAVHRIAPLYRERTVPTRDKLQRVPCASAAYGDTSACFALAR